MSKYTEVLPPSKSSRHSALSWVPADSDFGPEAGTLTIDTDRARVAYRVTEFPISFPGRGFHLEKTSTAGDKEEGGYDCFLSQHGAEGDSCTCKGNQRFGTCKHAMSLRALLENSWL